MNLTAILWIVWIKSGQFDVPYYLVQFFLWYILFDKSRDLKNQLQALELVLAEKIEEREHLEYIDLRIENRVYYK